MEKELPKGFTCRCGEKIEYSAYVFAHWDAPLVYACPKCGLKYDIVRGMAILFKNRKKKG